jgi:hypothetical protein
MLDVWLGFTASSSPVFVITTTPKRWHITLFIKGVHAMHPFEFLYREPYTLALKTVTIRAESMTKADEIFQQKHQNVYLVSIKP